MMSFSIVIPVFNEELNLNKLVEEIILNLSDLNKYEIIFVNDASTDNSLIQIKKLIKKKPKLIKVVENKINLGQSYSLIEGIKASINKTIVTIDGDGQNNPRDIPILLNKYQSNQNIFLVGGIRFRRKDNLIKIFSSKVANSIRSKILKDNCPDTGCSLKVFDKHVFMQFPFFNGIHRFLPALFKGFGKQTYFINVDHRFRIHGHSKYGTFLRLFRGIKDLIRVAIILKKFKRNRA